MKRFMLNTFLLSLAVALWGCGGSGDDPEPAAPTITTSMEAINAPANGGNYTINVTTTGKEWGVYTEGDFVKVTANYTSNSVSVIVDENPNTSTRTGNVVIMSGIARKSISVNQAAAEETFNTQKGCGCFQFAGDTVELAAVGPMIYPVA